MFCIPALPLEMEILIIPFLSWNIYTKTKTVIFLSPLGAYGQLFVLLNNKASDAIL